MPNSPARPTGNTQVFLSSLVRNVPQLWCADEVLHHHDVCHVVAQRVDQLAVGRPRRPGSARSRWSARPAGGRRCPIRGTPRSSCRAVTLDGASLGRMASGCFCGHLAEATGTVSGRATAIATHTPITAQGHRTTRSASRRIRPHRRTIASPGTVPSVLPATRRVPSARCRRRARRPNFIASM